MKIIKIFFRLFSTAGLIVLITVPVFPALAADTAVSVEPEASNVPEGSDFGVWISVDNVLDFDAAQYDITYNPSVIEVTGVDDGLIGTDNITVAMWASVNSTTIRVINNVEGYPGVTGSGYLSIVHFEVVGATGASSNITLSNGVLGDKDANEIEATWTSGSVNIVAAVTADFLADVTEVLVGQAVNFTATPTGGSGSYEYAWDFDNNGSTDDTAANPSYSYPAAGTYTVTLTVTDTFNGSDNETKADYITVYDTLVADCSSDVSEAATGQTISFSESSTGGKIGYTYEWDFGDGFTDNTTSSPAHSYAASGNYTITLTVTDNLDNEDTDTITISVYARGDADKNGTVQTLDLTHIEHIIMGDTGYDQTTWADANSDGEWNILDLTAVELIIISSP